MKSNALNWLLEQYNPSPEEVLFKQRFLNLLNKHPNNCFDRTHFDDGHITASAFLLSADCSKVLLMHHAKLNLWVQPGGHCDGDPDVLAVALKEAREETGILAIHAISSEIFDIDIHVIPARFHEPEHYHYDVRFLLRAANDVYVQNHESKALAWVPISSSALPTQERSVVRMFEKVSSSIVQTILSAQKSRERKNYMLR